MHILRLVNFKTTKSWKCLMATQAWTNNQNAEQACETKIERLNERSLLKIKGQDASNFLQGLITNDINYLFKEKLQTLYTMFLNVRGRVVHDGLVYKTQNQNCFLIETDITSLQALQIHLSLYKAHHQVYIENAEPNYSVWAIFNPNKVERAFASSLAGSGSLLDDNSDLSFLEEINFGDDVVICYDPRIISLGTKIVAPKELDIFNLIKASGFQLNKAMPGEYRLLRYKLGIGEGINEFQYGKYFPKELNCDYLKSLSNKKEAYLGKQFSNFSSEKRMMPIKLLSSEINGLPINTPLIDLHRRKKTPLGHLRGINGVCGIALVRVPNFDGENEMRIGTHLAQCIKPFWWPDFGKSLPGRQNISFA
ncbi:putative transferase CAF17 homolog, mitochondrial [Rhodnius prolixus]